jgi:uroporphyrinogen decarboxylase
MAIAETTRAFIQAASRTGIAGVFYAVQHAQYQLLTPLEYQSFGSAYDLLVLEPSQELWLNMLHLHGENVMFDLFEDYPVGILNWHDQDTPPDLAEGQRRFRGVVCGGLQRERTMVLGNPDEVKAEAQRAILATGGKRFILGTGCVVPITAPRANLLAARKAVEAYV